MVGTNCLAKGYGVPLLLDESSWWLDWSGDSTGWDEIRQIDQPLSVTSFALTECMVTPDLHIPDMIGRQSGDSGKWRDFGIELASRYRRRKREKRVRFNPNVIQESDLARDRADLN
jgi:hypothetical protein